MTNEVENLILKNEEYRNIDDSEQISYLLYKNIWQFILEMLKYNPDSIKVYFKINKVNNEYFIMENSDIKYLVIKEDNYYYNYNNKSITKLKFNLKTFYKLLESDDFKYNISIFKDFLLLNVTIDKEKINEVIQDTLLKNGKVKILKKGE